MTTIDPQGRPEPPPAADEATMLSAFLNYQRATLEWKTRGLDEVGLRTTLRPTTMTLGGLLKHMAWVEDYWFRVMLLGLEPAAVWSDADWDADGDWEWNSAGGDAPETLRALWSDAVESSRSAIDGALNHGVGEHDGLDTEVAKPFKDGSAPTLRWILVHMIEEYARHNGHADLLRESVDGETGE